RPRRRAAAFETRASAHAPAASRSPTHSGRTPMRLRVLRVSACIPLRALLLPFSALSIIAACASAPPAPGEVAAGAAVDTARHRTPRTRGGYLPAAPTAAALCALERRAFDTRHGAGRRAGQRVRGPRPAKAGGAFGRGRRTRCP